MRDINGTYVNAKVKSVLDDYCKSLDKEIYCVRNKGGRFYTVSNGEYMGLVENEYAFYFEVESELHIADSSPISLEYHGRKYAGSLLDCQDFYLICTFKEKIDEKIPIAQLNVEPWKLLQFLKGELEHMYEKSYPIAEILIGQGPQLCGEIDKNKIKLGQEEAIKSARNMPVSVVWGPPGTGKTYTLAKIAITAMRNKKRVLLVSHSNVSVDGAINKIVDILGTNDNQLVAGKVLRYGYVRDKKLSENEYASSYNYVLSKNSDYLKEKNKIESEIKKLKQTENFKSQKGADLTNKLKMLREKFKNDERRVIKNAFIVGTTISKVLMDKNFRNTSYDTVIFDEASMAYVPHVFGAAMHADNHFVIVGDFMQLPPISSSGETNLEEDIFSYLGIRDQMGKVHVHPWLTMLNIQRRSHEDIVKFINEKMYGNLLENDEAIQKKVKKNTNLEPFSGHALVNMNLAGMYCAEGKTKDNSRYNILSAYIAFSLAINIETNSNVSVGIICPYAAQTRIINAMIYDYKTKNDSKISCATIHQFQGSERDVIIFDAVESYPGKKAGVLMTSDGLERLINVAITRAKSKLITVSNNSFWLNIFDPKKHILTQFINYQKDKQYVASKKEIITNISSRESAIYQTYDSEIKALEDLFNDIRRARDNILIMVPDGKFDDMCNSKLYMAIQMCQERGIFIRVIANDNVKMQEKWRRLAEINERAFFPLIIIDGKKAWYGLPKTDAYFRGKSTKEGEKRYTVVQWMAFRFVGENLCKILLRFTDLDNGLSMPSMPVLSTGSLKDELNREDTHKSKGRLFQYLLSNYECEKCGGDFKINKSQKGVYYFQCKKCSVKDWITLEMLEEFDTETKGCVCPVHRCSLKIGLGKRGIYALCHKGDGHFVDLGEL